jgi:hypothetical protein
MNNRKRKAYRMVVFFLGLLVFYFYSTASAQRLGLPVQPVNKPVTLKIHVDEAGVTANIVNCPMQTVLKELAERTGIIFEVRTQDNLPVSLNPPKPVNLTEFIKRVVLNNNTLFFYGPGDSQRITLVKVFSPQTALPQPSIAYLGSGAITKSNDDILTAEQAFKVLLDSKDVEMREKAVEYLVSSKNAEAAGTMMRFISDSAPEIRVAVIDGLAALNARNALPTIIRSLKDAHAGVRQSAITAIALLGDYSNIKDLKPLVSDKDANVVAAAEMAMRKLSATKK